MLFGDQDEDSRVTVYQRETFDCFGVYGGLQQAIGQLIKRSDSLLIGNRGYGKLGVSLGNFRPTCIHLKAADIWIMYRWLQAMSISDLTTKPHLNLHVNRNYKRINTQMFMYLHI